MTDLQNYIRSYFGISDQNMDDITALFVEEELKKGEFYLKAGRYCEKMSFVQSGHIRIFAEANDKEVTQWISSKDHFITELSSFIFGQRARFNMQALSDCKLYTIDQNNYRTLNTLVPNWTEMEKKFLSSCFVMLENRVFNHLAMTAEERYDQLFEDNKDLFNQVPLQYLASMLGMSAETFSRIRKKKNS